LAAREAALAASQNNCRSHHPRTRPAPRVWTIVRPSLRSASRSTKPG
jgi:hypothetical protein